MRRRIMRRLIKDADSLYDTYIKWAKVDAATIRHAIDKLLPDEQPATIQPTAVSFQFVQFGSSNQNPLQLSATTVSAPVLVSDERGGEEPGREGLASSQREGQDGPQFHSFSNVPAKRRENR